MTLSLLWGINQWNKEQDMGTQGCWTINDNGHVLVNFREANSDGLIFNHKEIHKLTWTPPDGKKWRCTLHWRCESSERCRCWKWSFPWEIKDLKLIQYQFWCSRCAFRLMKCLQWCSGRKKEIWKKNCENFKRTENTKYDAMKLSQICQRIELCMREIIFRFEMNL
jgi:hypothetical protein